ncbi:DUF2835 family protein [Paraferrimonas sedimenticola]|uniref:DUF2835 domain-containing protein n=1 Tax=Paraferrimonas sedimenticola TaxID=375674 RepID=A0AA37RZU0_9GAMM|nr:DUF2835 family protein [Paraferrimonas sedimenticola]GLP98069.1 hypothetical protein GCM10007895_33760 [Paraferrimonas sedimenticola]
MQTEFYINLSYQQMLPYYQGSLQHVEVRDRLGRVLHIHARHFRSYFSPSGIQGLFRIQLSENGEFLSLQRISS